VLHSLLAWMLLLQRLSLKMPGLSMPLLHLRLHPGAPGQDV
jgi:hypothetical protein